MTSMQKIFAWSLGLLVLSLLAAVSFLELRNRIGSRRAEAQYAAQRPARIAEYGSTRTLSILPLIDWHSAGPELRTEMGVSYLIETDEHRILFDLGQNAHEESPSPLELNMKALGVSLDSIDTIFISHNHFDHVGGKQNQKNATFSLGREQQPLPDKRAFVPIPMSYPGLSPVHSAEARRIGKGVASTGTIPRQLIFGWIDEQALVVNVEGLGAVLIVGCGHQTLPKLLDRYDRVFREPLYGIVGGLHFPVPEGRLKLLGLDAQQIFASGDGMFSPITMDEVKAQVDALDSRNLGVVGLGGHDSSDEVIAMFQERFGDSYRPVRVGERIVIDSNDKTEGSLGAR